MLIATFIFIASIVNRRYKTMILSYLAWNILLLLYVYMNNRAMAFVPPPVYYSVNTWRENLILLASFIELPGVYLWLDVIFCAFTGRNIREKYNK